MRLYREEVGFLYTFGYGLFRSYFRALGEHFVKNGYTTGCEDIFYLYFDEIVEIVKAGEMKSVYAENIAQRKREIRECQNVTLPHTIYGDQPPPLTSHMGRRLKGIPTSKGSYQGKLRVVKGIKDFYKVREGDVLAIPYSDVGWTPLFSKVGAIVAESGGFLSHSSIVAREFEIPALVSVQGACQLKDDTVVTVDAYHGELVIH
jgi:pyruvate,water dikinase